jgi:hypothetical protein
MSTHGDDGSKHVTKKVVKKAASSKTRLSSRERVADSADIANNDGTLEVQPSTSLEPAHAGPVADTPASLKTPDDLHAWLVKEVGIRVPRTSLIEGHAAPFDYLQFAFFGEATETSRPIGTRNQCPDCVVWANRGGGKTFLGAVATMLDLVFKPGIEVRILGGSLEQSRRMHAQLRRLFDPHNHPMLASMVKGKITETRIRLINGSEVELLAQSHQSIRGTRVQKLRCDEVDLFKRDVWEAAQLTTRSKQCGDFFVRGSVECLSTMHVPHGVMHDLVQEARAGERRLFRWGVVDALEHCPPQRECKTCVLFTDCAGKAKQREPEQGGHVAIDDAIAMKRRVALATWEAEMLCLRVKRTDAVLPEFEPRVHVVDRLPEWLTDGAIAAKEAQADKHGSDSRGTQELGSESRIVQWLAGMDFGFRAPTVVLWAALDDQGVLWVVDEHVARGHVLEDHIAVITKGLDGARRPEEPAALDCSHRPWPACAWIGVDPAGNNTNDHTGVSSVTKMRQAGLTVKTRRMGVVDGLALVRARLAPADGNGPRLFVHQRCEKLIESLERYHYPEDDPESDSPVKRDGFDHAVDALRYMIQNLDKPHKTGVRGYL